MNKPPGISLTDVDFLYVTMDQDGGIVRTVLLRAPANQGDKAGHARSLLIGDRWFQVYRLKNTGKGKGNIEFERVI